MRMILGIALLLQTFHLHAGHETGNGGDIVTCKKDGVTTYQLLDHYEAIFRGFMILLPEGNSIEEKITSILENLKEKDKYLAEKFRRKIDHFWKNYALIPNVTLTDIPDSNQTYLGKGCEIEQIAINQRELLPGEKKYIISEDLWKELDLNSKTGLILHEIIYDFFLNEGDSNSRKARYFNSLISSSRFLDMDMKEYNEIALELGLLHVKNFTSSFDSFEIQVGLQMGFRETSTKGWKYSGKDNKDCKAYEKESYYAVVDQFNDQYLFENKGIYKHEDPLCKKEYAWHEIQTAKYLLWNLSGNKEFLIDPEEWCSSVEKCDEYYHTKFINDERFGKEAVQIKSYAKWGGDEREEGESSRTINSIAPYLSPYFEKRFDYPNEKFLKELIYTDYDYDWENRDKYINSYFCEDPDAQRFNKNYDFLKEYSQSADGKNLCLKSHSYIVPSRSSYDLITVHFNRGMNLREHYEEARCDIETNYFYETEKLEDLKYKIRMKLISVNVWTFPVREKCQEKLDDLKKGIGETSESILTFQKDYSGLNFLDKEFLKIKR